MSSQRREPKKRTQRYTTIHKVERLEGRALLASFAEFNLTSGSNPAYITTGPDNNLWFTEQGSDKIGRMTTSGVVTEFALTSGSHPQGITTGPNGNLWFVETLGDKIGEITTSGTITEFALTSGSHPQEITTGSNGNLWFTENGTHKIGEIVPSGGSAGTITEFALASGSFPYGITSGPNGNLWFTEGVANKVGQIVPSGTFAGTINTYSLSNGAGPRGITTGSDGNLWFIESDGGNIGQVTLGGSVTEFAIPGTLHPSEIVSGPGGDLYFTPYTSDSIGRMSTSGTFTFYSIPVSTVRPIGITVGPDNHIWTTDSYNDQIDRLNIEPTAVDHTYTAGENTPSNPTTLTVNAVNGLLSGDTDPENDPLTVSYSYISAPFRANHGSVTVSSNGSFTYTPDNNYTGPDNFYYTAFDGNDDSSQHIVNINVDAPPVANVDYYNTPVSTTLIVSNAALGVLANDTDPNSGHTLTASTVTQPSHGTLSFNTNGTFGYLPTAGYHGTDSFTYRALDSDGFSYSNTATVTIAVDTAPVANADAYTTDRNTTLTVSLASNGVLANDTDADGDPITAVLATTPLHGNLTLNANGTLTYIPNAGYTGGDSFTYLANDGTLNSNSATVTLTINALPVASNDSYEVLKNGSLSVSSGTGVQANDTGTGSLTSTIVGQPSHGTVTLNANGSFTYIPTAGYSGNDSFTYKDNDGIADGNTATVTIKVDNAPVAVADSYLVLQNTPLTKNAAQGVLANDTDADADPLTAVNVTNPTHGTLTLNADGSFTYTPSNGYHGTDSFTYKANDGFADSNTVTVTLNVDAPPVVLNKSYTDVKNTSLNVLAAQGLLVGATDSDGDPITAGLVSQPTHGTVTINANGSFSYIPTTGYFGNDSFTFAANDGFTNGNTGTVSVYVDQPPVGVADNYTVVENTGLTRNAAQGVLANDVNTNTFTSPVALTAGLISTTTHGALTLFNDGSFSYIPTAGYYGSDSFTYQANDGITDSPITTVSIRVDAPPVGVADSYNAILNTTLTKNAAQGVLANDSDPDNTPTPTDTLTASLISNAAHGVVTLFNDGSFTYVPTNGYTGTDSFTYKPYDQITNGNLTTVNIRVDAPPVAVNDSYTTLQNVTLTENAAAGVLANDTDTEGDPITAVIGTNPAHGTVTLNADGSFTYVPTAGFYGTDSFTYNANDGYTNGVSPATVTIRVDAPPVAVADSYITAQNATLTRNIAQGVLNNDTDADGDPLTAVVVANPTHGTLTLNANGSFTYIPTAGYYGPDSFTYKANDGITDSNTATVTIRVDALPVSVNDSYSTIENTTLTKNAVLGVLANDTDPDVGDTLSAVLVSNTTHGSITLNGDGSFTYIPTAGYYGNDSFTYQANDGYTAGNVATVSIYVDAPPVAVNDSYSAREGMPLTVNAASGVLTNDTQAQGNALTASVVTQPTHGTLTLNADGSFTYTPTGFYFGSDSFTYTVNDGYTNSLAPATVTFNVVQDNAPVANNVSQLVGEGGITVNAPGILTGDTDSDSDPLTALLVSQPSHGTLTFHADGSFVYIPDSSFGSAGTDSFTYRAFDGVLTSNLATVTLTFDGNYYAPTAQPETFSTTEGATLTTSAPGLLAGAQDYWNLPLTAVVVTNPAHGTLTPDGNGDGGFVYTPNSNYYGADSFTYQVNNGHTSSSAQTVTLNISQTFGAPVASNDNYAATEATPLTITSPGLLANDTDPNGDPLTAILVTNPAHGSVALNADGSFTYTPVAGYYGSDSFTYKDNNGHANSNTATVSFTISQVFYAPVAVNDTFSTPEATGLTRNAAQGVLANDTDPQSLALTATLVTGPAHSDSFTLNPDGSFSYTPSAGFYGTDTFTYMANDGHNNSNLATVTFAVTQVIYAPVAVNDAYSTPEATVLTRNAAQGVLANDTDPQSLPLGSLLVTNAAHGTVALLADGSFTYTPAPGYYGPDSFTYKDNNGSLNGNTATVSLTVTQVFYAPVAVNDSFTTPQNTTFGPSGSNVLANDTDPQSLTLAVVSPGSFTTAHGLVNLAADGTFTYTPSEGFEGTDTFTYMANDGHNNSNVATVTINVSQVIGAPVAVNDSYTTSEATPLTRNAVQGVLANDTDPQSNPLTAILVTNPAHGSVSLNADGSFTYTPAAGYYGSDSFTYKDNNGSLNGNTATVSLTVNQVFYAPVAVNDTYSIANGETLTISTPGVLANDTDPNGLTLNSQLFGTPSHDSSFTFNNDGSFTYTPTPGFVGTDSFTYKAADGNAISSLTTVTITVTNPLTVTGTTASATAGTSFTGNVGSFTDADPTAPIGHFTALIQWGDSSTTVGTITQPGGVGTAFQVSGTHTYSGPGSLTASILITDNNENSASANTAVTVASATIQPPVAVNDSYTTNEATPLTRNAAQGVLSNDSDPQSLPLGSLLVTNAAHGTVALLADGSFTYTPAPGYYGPDSFTYKDNNGSLNSNTATVSLTVTHVNHPPVAVNDSFAASEGATLTVPALTGVLANDTDPDTGDVLTASVVTAPGHAGSFTLNTDGSFTYLPAPGFTGTDTFTYKVSDGTAFSNTATVTLNVTSTLTATGQPIFATQGTPFAGPVASVSDTNPSASIGSLSAVIHWGDDTSSAGIVTQPGGVGTPFIVSGSHNYSSAGGFAVSVQITETTGSTASTTTIASVSPSTLQPPVAVNDSQTVGEGGFTAASPGLLANDTDPNSLPLSALLVTGPAHGTLSFHSDGSYTYIPNSSFGTAGTDTFTYRAFDGNLTSNLATVTLTFSGTYATPVAQPQAYTLAQGTTLTENAQAGLLAGANDYWSLPLTAIVTNQPTHGTLVANADGSFTYSPNAGFFGSDSFTYQANNGQVSSTAQAVTITVTHVNHPPVAVADSFSTTAGQPTLSVASGSGVLANDTDSDSDPLTAILVSGPAHGSLVLNANGSFVYTAAAGYSGLDSFTYEAFDGQALSNVATATLTVHPKPVPPPAVPGDYDGDGKADIAVYIPSLGAYDIKFSGGMPEQIIKFGTPGLGNAIPAPGDYDHSGKTELAVYMPASGSFVYRPANGGSDVIVPFGTPGFGASIPAPGDYFGTGQTDIAVYLPSMGVFAVRNPVSGVDSYVAFGTPGLGKSIPTPGDYDASGKTEIAVYLPTQGAYAYRPVNGGADKIIPFGIPGTGQSIPMPGDYDGSGKTEVAVYMPSQGRFAFRPANGGPDVNIPFGTAGAGQTLPAPGDYTGVGHDELAVYIPASGTFIIRTSGTSPDMNTPIGIPGLGLTIPVTVVDEALAQMPTGVSGLSIAIPDLGSFTTTKKKNNGGH